MWFQAGVFCALTPVARQPSAASVETARILNRITRLSCSGTSFRQLDRSFDSSVKETRCTGADTPPVSRFYLIRRQAILELTDLPKLATFRPNRQESCLHFRWYPIGYFGNVASHDSAEVCFAADPLWGTRRDRVRAIDDARPDGDRWSGEAGSDDRPGFGAARWGSVGAACERLCAADAGDRDRR